MATPVTSIRDARWWLVFSLELAALFGYLFLIFWLSSRPTLISLSLPQIQVDKVVHCAAYFVLSVLFVLPFFRVSRSIFWSAWAAFLLASLYGLSDEIHQSFVPGRSADVYDYLADALGALMGAVCWAVWAFRKKASMFPPTDS